jgi:hypothetical protein
MSSPRLSVIAGADPRDPGCYPCDPTVFRGTLDRSFRGTRVAWRPDLDRRPLSGRSVGPSARSCVRASHDIWEKTAIDRDRPARVCEQQGSALRDPRVAHHPVRLPRLAVVGRESLRPLQRIGCDVRPQAAHLDRLAVERLVGEERSDAVCEAADPRNVDPGGMRPSSHQSAQLLVFASKARRPRPRYEPLGCLTMLSLMLARPPRSGWHVVAPSNSSQSLLLANRFFRRLCRTRGCLSSQTH